MSGLAAFVRAGGGRGVGLGVLVCVFVAVFTLSDGWTWKESNISNSASQTSFTDTDWETLSLWEFCEFRESIVYGKMLCSFCPCQALCSTGKMSSWWCQLKCFEGAKQTRISGAPGLERGGWEGNTKKSAFQSLTLKDISTGFYVCVIYY